MSVMDRICLFAFDKIPFPYCPGGETEKVMKTFIEIIELFESKIAMYGSLLCTNFHLEIQHVLLFNQ